MSLLSRHGSGTRQRPLIVGTLVTEQYATRFSGGCRAAMQELFWDRYQPTSGASFDSTYGSGEATWAANMRAAGMQVTLAPGLDWAPDWAFALNGANYVNQNGDQADQLNVIFSQAVRNAAQTYFNRINTDFNLSTISAIRLTSGGSGEMLYPDFDPGLYWAYDVNAQNGAGRPSTMPACPFPGWKPGQTSITTTQVGQWVDWYIDALVDVTQWQMSYLDGLGFKGRYEILCPGSGTRPSLLTSDIASRLTLSTPTCVGAVWHKYWERLTAKSARTVVYQSSMSDQSGDGVLPQPADVGVALTDAAADNWSATRWTARIAKEYNLRTGGENAGYDRTDLHTFYENTAAGGMMDTAFKEAKAANMVCFYWAHDAQLNDGTVSPSTFNTYVQAATV